MARAPKQIADQAAEADRLQREALGIVDEAADVDAAVEPDASAASASEAEDDLGASSAPEPAPNPTFSKVEVEVEEPAEDDWKHKYDVLRGKYDKEVPRLHGQVRDLSGRLESMENVLANVASRPAAKPAEETFEAPTGTAESHITPEMEEEYGKDFFDVVRLAAREALAPMLDDLKKDLGQLTQQTRQTSQHVAMSARERLFGQLDSQVENWREINKDQGFLGWLDEVDPYSGQPRGQLLRLAFENNDIKRVVAFFTGYVNENATLSQRVAEPGRNRPAPANNGNGAGAPRPGLETLAAPGRGRNTTVDARQEQQEGRLWTQAEVAAFYDDVRRGAFRGREEAQRATEAQIFAAANSGRIQS